MIKPSPQSKSFIILFTIALVGTYVCLMVGRSLNIRGPESNIADLSPRNYQSIRYSSVTAQAQGINLPGDSTETVDTSAWKTYTNASYGFSFKYAPTWKVKESTTKDGFDTILVDPGPKYLNITIKISKTGFFAIDGFAHTIVQIAGEPAIDIQGSLYGIKHGDTYYTFDQGMSAGIKAPFEALVKSVTFK